MKIEINLNDRIAIKLTDLGVCILQKYGYLVPEDGVWKGQLHAFIEIFGPHIGFVKERPCETNFEVFQ